MRCQCEKCNCKQEFEPINQEELLNVIQHGRLDQKQLTLHWNELAVNYAKSALSEIILKMTKWD